MEENNKALPEWYWTRGLHDARIVKATFYEPNFYRGNNRLILKINCAGAMFEQDITEIRFFGAVIKPDSSYVDLLSGGWWLSDELYDKGNGNGYNLELRFETEKRKTKNVEIRFYRIEVVRK